MKSERDYMLALAENEEYQRDFAQYDQPIEKLFNAPRIDLRKKWGIEIIRSPENIRQTYLNNRDMEITPAVELALHRLPEREHVMSHLQDGRYLFLKVDLTADKGEILKEAWKCIEQGRKQASIFVTQERNRDNEADHWEVYYRRKSGESLVQITKDIFHKVDDPHLDNPHYKSVKRAHKYAKDLIRLIKPLPH